MLPYLLIIVFVLLSAFFSGSEIGFYRTNPIRLRLRKERGWTGAGILQNLTENPRITISNILVGNNITHYVTVALCTGELKRLGVGGADFWSTIILSPILLVFAEIMPKVIFERRAEALMLRAAPALKACEWLFFPILAFLRVLLLGLRWLTGQEQTMSDEAFTTDRFRFFLRKSTAGGVISDYQHKMAANIMRLRSISLRECLVPLDEAVMAPVGEGVEGLKRILSQHRFSRIPVYAPDSGEILAIVNVIDMLSWNEECEDITCLGHPPVRIDQENSIVEALYALQRAGQQMAVITDSQDCPVGIVTVKDLVERIVGELEAW